jgi:hypothetical protein
MGEGHPPPSPEWRAICAEVRREFIKVCPLSNRRFDNEPGTFRRTQIADFSGVSLANIRRLVDQQLPCDPDSVLGLARFLGMRFDLERIGPPPTPSPSRPKRSPVGTRSLASRHPADRAAPPRRGSSKRPPQRP